MNPTRPTGAHNAEERMGLGRGDSVEPGLVATREAAMDEDQIYAELDRVRDDYRALLDLSLIHI